MIKEEKPEKVLPPIMIKRGSFSKAESLLNDPELYDGDRIMFRPIQSWTDQDNTEALLEQKRIQRDRYGWEVDFNDFKMPFAKSIKAKVDKLGLVDAL
jgi:hypothetical protein